MFHARNGGSLLVMDDHAPPDFVIEVDRDLLMLQSLPTGKDLLDLLHKRYEGVGKRDAQSRGTRIYYTTPLAGMSCVGGPMTARAEPAHWDLKRRARIGRFGVNANFALPAPAANGSVFYDPTPAAEMISMAYGLTFPTWLVLAHELIHALHLVSGDAEYEPEAALPWLREEARTVGLGVYRDGRISENVLRRESGLPERLSYAPGWDHTTVRSRISTPTPDQFRAALGSGFDLEIERLMLRPVT